ncbi:FAM50A-like protein [Tasmannia lanceolata]|uniref:FAM50A-like protein n=1 Tax=Tasmannia lanceolata TaxID=3420 RepID=UPI004062CF94
MDVENRRLKNRVRQQRYRARKRDEKAKRDAYVGQGDHSACLEENPLHVDFSILGTPIVANGHPASRPFVSSEAQPRQQDGVDDCGVNAYEDMDITNCDHHKFFAQNVIQPFPRMGEVNAVRECSKSHHDLTARRLKNRERQRRYRARKRVVADMKNAELSNQSTSLQIEPHPGGVVTKFEARVYCHRKWKKEAREICSSREPEDKSEINLENEHQACSLHMDFQACLGRDMHAQIKAEPLVGGNRKRKPSSQLGLCKSNDQGSGCCPVQKTWLWVSVIALHISM